MRRRCLGGGRKRVCSQVAELTMEWYSIVRHSIDTKIMCRFPKQVLLRKAKQFKTLVHELSVKLLSAEAQLAFLPKCQKMLTESKRTLATMQIKEQARARKREEGPLEVAVAVRHYNRKFISTWRTWVRNKVHAEAQRCQRSLQSARRVHFSNNA